MNNNLSFEKNKQELTVEIRKNHIPFYERWLIFIRDKYHVPKFIIILIFSFLPYLFGLLFMLLIGSDIHAYTEFWLEVNFSAWIAGMFFFMSYIYFKTIDFIDEIMFVLENKEQADEIRKCYELMFISKYQIIHSLVWGLIISATGLIMGVPLDKWGVIYMSLAAFVAGFLVATGLWYSITSSFIVYKFSKFNKIKLNLFEPSRTIGIRDIANLLGTWGICFMLESIIVLFGFFYADWSYGQQAIDLLHLFWSSFIFAAVIFVFLFPHILIKRLITLGKRQGAKGFQERITKILDNLGKHSPNELEMIERELNILSQYQKIYINIIKSPSVAIDLSVIGKFFSAMIIPLFIILFERPDYIMKLSSFIKEYVDKIL